MILRNSPSLGGSSGSSTFTGLTDTPATYTGSELYLTRVNAAGNALEFLSPTTYALASHSHAASDITSGTFDNARISQSSVTQHQAALSITESQISDLSHYTDSDADARITLQKGAANGLATLGSDSKIPSAQLPAIALTDVYVVISQAAQLALTAEEGDVAVRTDLNKSYIHNGGTAGTMADWQELLTPTDTVLSVNGYTGTVVLTTSDVAEGTNLYYTEVRVSANSDVAANTAARHAALTVTDSTEIDFTLTGQDLTAVLKLGSIDETKLDTSVNASLDLADSSVQPGDNISSLTNDSGFISDITSENLADLLDVIISSVADNEVLAYNTATSQWINQTASEAGLASASHTHAAGDITSGTFDNARISQSSVTQHQAALSITESQISDLDHYTSSDFNTDFASKTTTNLTEGTNLYFTDERAQDAVGTIFVDSSEIDFTYTDATPSITASIVLGSIDETKLDVSVNASLDLADSAAQPGDNISIFTNNSGYITGNQSITLSGDVTGTGSTSITTTIASGAVDIAMLSATGTPSASTFLRGDNTWATPAGGSGDVSFSRLFLLMGS